MDISTLEALKPMLISFQTLALLVLFVGIVWWAYSKRRKGKFDDAANSIFDEEEKARHRRGTEQDRAGANKK
ncbi:CcoQ/FixQ family Cbb3-type cytochrome c oxidase assembly chaperone [Zobellella endophytica]|uniref:CcoQ/FixQ family Cbb3-type cytochrome c oxidase assembly chaperone n=1 Tax=Zobellella endophytica TaxID=2116700 RepID=A0A2P7RCA5_9GAMM|nr:cbb3-type cytochrome c oxidase subunit 3 [Zobellella endophytica]PSJ47866.1 CcoQ/FixQ family Cbb3-type cytochrome c oxidase assembly chaperone [Zobellella endophytica]